MRERPRERVVGEGEGEGEECGRAATALIGC